MTNPQRLAAAALFAVAIVVGVFAARFVVDAIGSGPAPTPTPFAQTSASPVASPIASSSAAPSAPPSASASAPASPSAAASRSPRPTPTPKATNAPGRPAEITFVALKLDAADDPDGKDRVLTFRTHGTGTVRVTVVVDSPQGGVVTCIRTTKKDFGCQTSEAVISQPTNAKQAEFTVTLRGDGIAAPVVDVEVDFPSDAPSLTIEHARFDGTAYPDTNGIQALLTPAADGKVHLVASWGGHPLLYEVDLIEQGGPGVHALTDQGPAPGTDVSLGVVPPNPWKLVLENTETGFGVTDLTASITWP